MERRKAAEYGLVLLDQKQQLQYKNEKLLSLYETTKQELETTTLVSVWETERGREREERERRERERERGSHHFFILDTSSSSNRL